MRKVQDINHKKDYSTQIFQNVGEDEQDEDGQQFQGFQRSKKISKSKYFQKNIKKQDKHKNELKLVLGVIIAILVGIFFIICLKFINNQQVSDKIQLLQKERFVDLQTTSNTQNQIKTIKQEQKSNLNNLNNLNRQIANDLSTNSKQQTIYKNQKVNSQNTSTKILNQPIKIKLKQVQKRYVYGDVIDFTKIPRQNRDLARTQLTHDNLDKAAQFYNLLGKDIQKNETLKQISDMEIEYYDQKYQITQFQEEIEICVFILSYNNEPQNRYKASLDSVFQQNYQNYFVVYVNDVSSDRTGQLVQQYMDQHLKAKQKMTLINNQVRKRKSRNQYELAHQYCKPGAIMFPFDGDDCLIGRQTFKLLNAIYQKRQAKFVFLNFLQFVKSKPSQFLLRSGYSRLIPANILKNRNYRTYGVPLHLRTWISDIFLNISEADYKMNGQFVNVGEDVMVMYSLEELAGDKVVYVPQIVYAYNQDTGINDSSDDKNKQQRKQVALYAKSQRKLPQYKEKIEFRLKNLKSNLFFHKNEKKNL